MDNDIEHRIRGVIARRQAELAKETSEGDNGSHSRRLSHSRLMVELPRVSARIADAVGLLNDRLSESEMWLKVELADHSPIAEAIYTISLTGSNRDSPSLVITVDYTGAIRCILKNDGSRTLLGSFTVHSMGSAHLTDMLVALLEAHYH